MRRRMPLAALVAAATLLISQLVWASAPAAATTATLPQPQADIVVDATNGHILIADNIHKAMHPASTAKIMTALVAAERLAPHAMVTADAVAAGVEANKIGFTAGTQWPLDEMLAALMMVSANDAAYSIAYTVSGGLDAFSTVLNDTAHRLGMRDSTFNDPSGLDTRSSFKGGPLTSAYDLAIATRDALAVPEIATWAKTATYDFTDPTGAQHHFTNHNKMLEGGAYAYPGATGFKTGFTDQAQHSLVATATRNGRTLIAVILGAVDGGYLNAAALLDAGFATPADAPGVDPPLPPDHVSLFATRAADQGGWEKLASAPSPKTDDSGAGATTDVPAQIQPLATAPAVAHANTVVVHRKSSHGLLSTRMIVIAVVALAFGLVMLRRRAVKRQRAQRLARRRQRMAAMRSGGLPVVDGRYRPGIRVGPPLESHVRVRTMQNRPVQRDVDLDFDEELDFLDA